MTLATIRRISFQVTQSTSSVIKGQFQPSDKHHWPLCPDMLTGRSVLQEERKKKNGGKKWISVEACSGNKEAFKTGSHAHAKLGEAEVIVLIYTIVHAFCWVRNRPVLESQPHISQWRAFNSLAGWRMKQQSLQCCNGKDMGKEIGLS